MDETLLLQAKGRVAVTPDRKTGDVLLHFTEPSGRRVEVRLTDAGFVEGVNRVTVHAIVEGGEDNAVSLLELEER